MMVRSVPKGWNLAGWQKRRDEPDAKMWEWSDDEPVAYEPTSRTRHLTVVRNAGE